MKKPPSLKKIAFDVVKIVVVSLVGIALVISMVPFGSF